jgi:signal transduction histidine kinase
MQGQPSSSLRARLLVGFIFVTLLPSLAISIGSITTGYNSGKRQALDRLESRTELNAIEISTMLNSQQSELYSIINEQYMTDWLRVTLNLASRERFYDLSSGAIRSRFDAYITQTRHFNELLLLNPQGKVIVTSGNTKEGEIWQFFVTGEELGATGDVYAYISAPDPEFMINILAITGEDTNLVGYIAGISHIDDFHKLISDNRENDRTGKTYLVTQTHQLIPNSSPVTSKGIETALAMRNNTTGIMDDYRGVRVLGVYQWLPELNAVLVVEQDFTEALGGIAVTLGVNFLLTMAALGFAAAAVLFIVRSVGLEARVDERSQALADANRSLERRALQLETSASLSREITSILQIDALLRRVTQLIKESFGYYHVEIFLVSADGLRLQFGASSGPVEPQFLILPISEKSLNGASILSRQPVLANDAEADPRYLRDANLLDTRAELVIPLRIGEQVIGTLDVQSASLNAFSEEDTLVLQSLADQIAIAIENARLYNRSVELAAMEERNRLARDLHDSVTQTLYSLFLLSEGWRQLIRDGAEPRVEERLGKVSEITSQTLKEMRLLIHQLRPPVLAKEGLIGALRQRLDAVEYRAGVETRLLMDDWIVLPVEIEECFYYIAQEALNNALKHAAATKVTVGLRIQEEYATLNISDNGKGFTPSEAAQRGGLGLHSMRERVDRMGGAFDLISAPGQGTTITARIKIQGRN